jgi:hypothetical protein
MSAPITSPGDVRKAEAALQALQAILDNPDHTADLVTGDDGSPLLSVRNRHAQIGEFIYASDQSFFWPWGQPIAAIGNPQAAASKISDVLRATRQPAND